MALGDIGFLTQEEDPVGTTLIDACNGFNKLNSLAILWTVQHHWPAGTRLAFNCYNYWLQLLLRHPGEPPFRLMSWEGVTQGDPSLWSFMGSLPSPWQRSSGQRTQGLSPPFYADDAAFNGSAQRSAQLLNLLM